jgi:hypothetical protein
VVVLDLEPASLLGVRSEFEHQALLQHNLVHRKLLDAQTGSCGVSHDCNEDQDHEAYALDPRHFKMVTKPSANTNRDEFTLACDILPCLHLSVPLLMAVENGGIT